MNNLAMLQEPDAAFDDAVLSEDQQVVFDAVMRGENLFFTGSAGTCKSLLLRKLVQALVRKYKKEAVYVTALTGIAATNIGGSTVHSWAGVGLCQQLSELYSAFEKFSTERWRKTKVLIIDEISMMPAKFFHRLERIAREVRKCPAPFGGIQLILCGDFFQLPPIIRQNEDFSIRDSMLSAPGTKTRDRQDVWNAEEIRYKNKVFVFDADSWDKCINRNYYLLEKVFRQRDAEFVAILQDARKGSLSKQSVDKLMERQLSPLNLHLAPQLRDAESNIVATILYSHNINVSSYNQSELEKLETEAQCYIANDYPYITRPEVVLPTVREVEYQLRYTRLEKELQLKIGAQVICTWNFSPEIVNGSRGVVVGYRAWNDVDPSLRPSLEIPILKQQKTAIQTDKYPQYFNTRNAPENSPYAGGMGWFYSHPFVPVVRFQNGIELPMFPRKTSAQTHDYIAGTSPR